MKHIAVMLIAAALPCLAQGPFSQRNADYYKHNLAPYVVSPQEIVDRMLEAAHVRSGEMVYDLGCGDGRVLITAAQKYKAKGVGVELSASIAKQAEDSVRRLGLQNWITIIHGDLMDVNLSPADVVTLYLETSGNDMVRPNLEKYLRKGSRVVSYEFPIRSWKPNKVEKIESYNRPHQIYVYVIPAVKE